MKHIDDATVSDRASRVCCVRRNESDHARTQLLRLTIDRHLEFAFQHVRHLLVGMGVFGEPGLALDGPSGRRHRGACCE